MKTLPLALFAAVAAFTAWLLYVPGQGFTLHPIAAQATVASPQPAAAPTLTTDAAAAGLPAPATRPPAPGAGAPSAATPVPAPVALDPISAAQLASRVAQAQRTAIAKYPDLAVAGSEINSRFVFRYKRLLAEHSARLQDPSWPMQLADECAAASTPSGDKPRPKAAVAASR
jgi:hypothetical protein